MIITGQILGWVAALFTFISYQCKNHKRLLAVQTLSVVSICAIYLFLGAWSGMLLNAFCLVRNFIIFRKDIKLFSHKCWAYILPGVMAVVGFLSWQGYISLLMIMALTINTIFLYFPNVQNLRKSILLTSTMVIIYNVYFSVWGGVANEAIAISSSIIGLYRYRKKENE